MARATMFGVVDGVHDQNPSCQKLMVVVMHEAAAATEDAAAAATEDAAAVAMGP